MRRHATACDGMRRHDITAARLSSPQEQIHSSSHPIHSSSHPRATLRKADMPSHVVPCCSMPSHAVPCCSMLFHAVPCCSMLLHAVTCRYMPLHAVTIKQPERQTRRQRTSSPGRLPPSAAHQLMAPTPSVGSHSPMLAFSSEAIQAPPGPAATSASGSHCTAGSHESGLSNREAVSSSSE